MNEEAARWLTQATDDLDADVRENPDNEPTANLG